MTDPKLMVEKARPIADEVVGTIMETIQRWMGIPHLVSAEQLSQLSVQLRIQAMHCIALALAEAVEAEREACAICAYDAFEDCPGCVDGKCHKHIAAAIRARGKEVEGK